LYRFIYSLQNTLVRDLLYAHGFKQVNAASHDFNVMWTGGELEDAIFSNLSGFQKINHFPKSTELTRKDSLWKTMHSFEEEHQKNFNIVPESYVLIEDYQKFCQAFKKLPGPWIVKPVASSQGRGIYLMDSLSQLKFEDNVIISRYISNPLLIEGYKFDFRLYVLVTSFDPLIIYLYEEGLTRFATEKYQQSGTCVENKFVHLTNASLNKTSTKYVVSDDPEVEDFGNKWTMGALLRYLRQHGKDTTLLMEQIEDLIIKTIISAEGPIVEACRSILPQKGNCFELFGFDVLIDENLKPWLLEINRSPALECGSPLDKKIKDTLRFLSFSKIELKIK
uniref:Tubulin--tyrosine ligase-like protein 5 n=1 Tax=Leptobrachium leishanense TaxID=445787 RepID=A0A8C5WBP4_9ANUR